MSPPESTPPAPPARARLLSLDAYRGAVMLFLATGGFGIRHIAPAFEPSPAWAFLDLAFRHAKWTGCSLWDLIQPSFMFMVGVAMPLALAARRARGVSERSEIRHVVRRSFVLIALGIALESIGARELNFTFDNVLTQIGLGYGVVFALHSRRLRVQFAVAALLLIFWGFLLGLGATGYDRDHNAAMQFDVWFLNLFPRRQPFVTNGGGYVTLAFIPSIVTMLCGCWAGGYLSTRRPALAKAKDLLLAGLGAMAAGLLLSMVMPLIKRLWTVSWTVFSAGATTALLAAFFFVVDVRGRTRVASWLASVGMNSILAYLFIELINPLLEWALKASLGPTLLSGVFAPLWISLVSPVALLFLSRALHRRKLFLRI